MPYLKKKDKTELYDNRRKDRPAQTPGELNFVITTEVLRFINYTGVNYERINAAIGALECAKLELYRRLAAPYEDTKIEENGDVY